MTFLIDSNQINDEEFFNKFCEMNLMTTLSNLYSCEIYQVNLSILQGFGFLLINLNNEKYLNYIYQSEMLNKILFINIQSYDDEYLSFYINFLKSLILRVNTETIHYFYNEANNSFPIVENALKLYNYNNNLISTVVHNIILGVLNVKYEPIQDYFSKLPTVEYFVFISCRLRDLANRYINGESDNNDLYEDIIDELLYINDIICIGLKRISFIIQNAVLYYFLMPVLVNNLIKPPSTTESNNKVIEVVMVVLLAMFTKIKDKDFLELLCYLLFNEDSTDELLDFCNKEHIIENRNYFFTWEEQSQQKRTFAEFIMSNYSDLFFKALRNENFWAYQKEKEYPQLTKIKNYCMNIAKKNNDQNIDYHIIESAVMRFFKDYETRDMYMYHQSILFAIGIKVGTYFKEQYEIEDDNNQVTNCLTVIKKLKNGQYETKPNPIRSTLIQIITNYKGGQFFLWVLFSLCKTNISLLFNDVSKQIDFTVSLMDILLKYLEENKIDNNNNFIEYMCLNIKQLLCNVDITNNEIIQNKIEMIIKSSKDFIVKNIPQDEINSYINYLQKCYENKNTIYNLELKRLYMLLSPEQQDKTNKRNKQIYLLIFIIFTSFKQKDLPIKLETLKELIFNEN